MTVTIARSLRATDALDVHVLVDNVTDSLSTIPQGVVHEWNHLRASGDLVLSGEALCCAAFGLSLVITVHVENVPHVLLFDAGPEAYAISRNGDRLKIAFGSVGAIVLSHGHWDHAGGLLTAVDKVATCNGGIPVACHVNPGMFVTRAFHHPAGSYLRFKDIPSVEALAEVGAAVVNSPESRLVLEDLFYLSGEIPRVTLYDRGLSGHVKRSQDGESWEPDPWIMDERYVAVYVKNRGIVVFTACSHAGLINVLNDARNVFGGIPLYAVMGGFHLSGLGPEKLIPETIEDLKTFGLKKIVPGHCTGWRAISALSRFFNDDMLVPCAVGRKFHFSAAC